MHDLNDLTEEGRKDFLYLLRHLYIDDYNAFFLKVFNLTPERIKKYSKYTEIKVTHNVQLSLFPVRVFKSKADEALTKRIKRYIQDCTRYQNAIIRVGWTKAEFASKVAEREKAKERKQKKKLGRLNHLSVVTEEDDNIKAA